jgi:DNA-binding transcriptional MocR family regulator
MYVYDLLERGIQVTKTPQAEGWRPALPQPAPRPIYRAIVDAMAADIDAGRLAPGQQLPTHRALAAALDVDFTTITRAYAEAQRRGLIEAVVGRGTFVRAPGSERAAAPVVDFSMNLPPQPADAEIRRHLVEGLAEIVGRRDFSALLAYGESSGTEADRTAGVAWLKPLLPDLPPERLLVCSGAQNGLLALLTTYVRPGELVLTEALTFPGFRALAGHFGVRLQGVAMDGEGLLPDALDEACAREKAKALYTVPTIHNPTTATLSPARRQAIAAVARRHGLLVFEDDTYGLLPPEPLPPIAAFMPEAAFYVSSLAKCLTPGLRIAYLVAPATSHALRLAATFRATTTMVAPPMTALASHWIKTGVAQRILAAVRGESAARQRIAAAILPAAATAAHPYGHHVWLRLPPAWRPAAFASYARRQGLAAVPGDAFAEEPIAATQGVRLALGAADDRDSLRRTLRVAADALDQNPALFATIV